MSLITKIRKCLLHTKYGFLIGSSLSKCGVYEGGLIKGYLVVKRWEPLDCMILKMKIHCPSEEI